MTDDSEYHPRRNWGRQVAQSALVHYGHLNGHHAVRLCNPELLATRTTCTDRREFVTCVQCKLALADPEREIKSEVHKRMNSK